MEEPIRLECFRGTKRIQPQKFYVYTLKVLEAPPDLQADTLLNSAVRRLNKRFASQCYFAVRKHDKIYTVREVAETELNLPGTDKTAFRCTLAFMGQEEVPLSDHEIYEGYLKQLVESHLAKLPLYQRSARDVLTSVVKRSKLGTSLLREYRFHVKVTESGEVYLFIDTSARFDTDMTVYQQIKNCQHDRDKLLALQGEFVTYNLNTSFPQSGYLVSLKRSNVYCTRESLVKYYQKNYPQPEIQQRIAQIPADDHVVQVRLKSSQKMLSYLSSLLKPVLTTETVARREFDFFHAMQGQMKRPMKRRLALDQQILADIGKIAEFGDLAFLPEPVRAAERKFQVVQFALPTLIAGKNCRIQANDRGKRAIFQSNIGYYRAPKLTDAQLKIQFVNVTRQQNFPERSFFVNLLNLALKHTIKASFDKISLKICHEGDGITPDILLVLVPERRYADYSRLKQGYAQWPMPSQMVSLEQAKKILRLEKYADNIAQNIAMGILGKLGGIPFVLETLPGADERDLFVGLDVGMKDAKQHYPACSVVLDGRGEFLGCYEPANAQPGEKIDNEHLRLLFDAVLTAYQQKYHAMPRHLILHRDGFSHEDDSWYQSYFGERNIRYAILEIRKSGAPRIANLQDDFFNNPLLGTALVRGDTGILVTTQTRNGIGAPQPLLVCKKYGNIDLRMALEQIYCLTKLHTGSLHNLRLPITTYYADQICKSLDFLPKGQFLDKLYFL